MVTVFVQTLSERNKNDQHSSLKHNNGLDVCSQAVESSLRSVNLFDNGVADKQCQRYSGGMKRRLSVAISLIGNPQVKLSVAVNSPCLDGCLSESVAPVYLFFLFFFFFLSLTPLVMELLQVVYMDEPSTGLDPASRYNLWSVVKQSKANRAIILTSLLSFPLSIVLVQMQ